MENLKNCKFILIKLILCIGVLNYVKTSTPETSTYTVGVVEYAYETSGSNETMLRNNLNGYRDLIKQYIETPEGYEVDIIIFPESTLNNLETLTFVPDPKNKTVLCDPHNPNPEFLSKLSCWAGQFKKYMVFNIIEKVNCTKESQLENNDKRPCAKDGLTRYNTNIVFDKNGALISRYRKWNLFIENMKNTTTNVELISFETDFGVKFGTFICFDILFWTPTQKLIQNGIKDFVYPTMWFSELPFMTANQVQQAWAFANNVTLLVSGANNPTVGSTGSGIFVGRNGAIVSEMSGRPINKMYITRVPKYNSKINQKTTDLPTYSIRPERLFGLNVSRDETVNKFKTVLLNSTNLNVEETVCYDKFCCNFKVVRKPFSENSIHYWYRLVAYAGERDYAGIRKGWLKTCAIIACTDDKSLDSCGKVFDDNIQYWNTHFFESIEISGDFKKQEELLIMPNSVDAMFEPIPASGFDFSSADIGKTTKAVMKLKTPVSDLLTFGIYANYYNGFSSASRNTSYFIVWILAFILIFCKIKLN